MSFVIVDHDGVRRRIPVVRTDHGAWVGFAGGAALVRSARDEARAAASEGEVVAPMTGKVVQVRVAPGQSVTADEVLVVLEAMKMEYRLTAPREGTVASVGCREGQLVELGATLVTFEG
jgi:biotin carboxyl carrier protein